MGNFSHWVDWMNANKDLAGWVQAAGALIAILIAIAVPAWQRRTERRDALVAQADLNATLAQAVFFLLSDVLNFLEGHLRRASMARGRTRSQSTMDDFFTRIAALESREVSPTRIQYLFHARGTVTQTQLALVDWLDDSPLSEGEIKLLQVRVELIRGYLVDANKGVDAAFRQRALVRLPLFMHPFGYGLWMLMRKWKKEEQIEK